MQTKTSHAVSLAAFAGARGIARGPFPPACAASRWLDPEYAMSACARFCAEISGSSVTAGPPISRASARNAISIGCLLPPGSRTAVSTSSYA